MIAGGNLEPALLRLIDAMAQGAVGHLLDGDEETIGFHANATLLAPHSTVRVTLILRNIEEDRGCVH